MAECRICGKEYMEGASVCPHCGRPTYISFWRRITLRSHRRRGLAESFIEGEILLGLLGLLIVVIVALLKLVGII